MTSQHLSPNRLRLAQVLMYPGLLGIIVEFLTDTHWLLPGSLMLALSGAWLGFARLTCPKCGMKRISICEAHPLCSVCKYSFNNETTPR